MADAFHPATGRWPRAARPVAAIGWLVLAAALAAGITGRMPPLAEASRHRSPMRADVSRAAREAEDTMRRAEEIVRSAKAAARVPENPETGPDPTGLLGDEVTPLMTTLGSLEAKRLASRPAWARVLTEQLAGAGIARGDLVVAGFSGSFPGLNLALMSACQSLGADLVGISSVTASTWGANQPGFTWPEMEALLVEHRILRRASVAVTAGGDEDRGLGLDEEGARLAVSIRDETARRLGAAALAPGDFADAVSRRLAVIRAVARGRPIRLYVNVGGADASLGRSAAILRFRSGFLPAAPFGRPSDRGVMGRLAEDGVPSLLLLNVRDLALRWGVE